LITVTRYYGVQNDRWDLSPGWSDDARASDADRDQAVEILNHGLATGQLDPAEHDERLQRALEAEFVGDLRGLTVDLRRSETRYSWLTPSRHRAALAILSLVLVGILILIGIEASTPARQRQTVTTTTPEGFVKPEPALVGKFCRAMARNQVHNPGSNPSGITSSTNFWNQPVTVPPGAPPSVQEDLSAAQSAVDGTFAILQAWQANGYQYRSLTTSCINEYDPAFDWIGGGKSSTGPLQISTSFKSEHSLLAVRSASGTCWYELNVMTSGDPIIDADGLPAYGSFSATSSGVRCSADSAPGYALWQQGGAIPTQLQTELS
jgi:Domain of unknown function (DUF1707)